MNELTPRYIVHSDNNTNNQDKEVQGTSHFADDYTKSCFTKQGRIVVERVLPAAGINLHIKATPPNKEKH